MYNVKVYETAKADLRDIVEYLNTLSPQSAIKYYDLLVEKIKSLEDMPERCQLVKDTQLRLRGYRALYVDNYIVFYVINSDVVQIRRILYAKRQYEWML